MPHSNHPWRLLTELDQVIKALYDYQVQDPVNNPGYLSFTSGEFLHVVDRENDPDWYEACNPIVGTRGLVPVNHFDLVSKTVGPSGGLEPVAKSHLSGSNGSIDQTTPASQGHDSGYAERQDINSVQPANSGIRMSRLGRQSGAMVYGIVQYDFKAERPDELEARAGEAIIVIAQSNPEWFVAKPITRLGGPGLIPVSFIEIRDMTTGKSVPDTQDAVTRAGVPKVEEWKRMAASYKNSSIPLGRLDSQSASERTSISGAATTRPSQESAGHMRQPSGAGQQLQSPTNFRFSQFPHPLKARVPRYAHHEMKYWFVIEAFMDDGKQWELNREYTDFYALQTQLMDDFPEAAGKVDGTKRTLPFMPGPLPWVTERLTHERREHMDRYLMSLLSMPAYIVSSQAVKSFFSPRDGDQETEGDMELSSESDWVRLSQSSSQQSMPHDSRQSSTGNVSNTGTGYTSPSKGLTGYQNQYGTVTPTQGHYRMRSASQGFSNGGQGPGAPAAVTSPVKIKIFFGDTNCVVVRLPSQFNFGDLEQKVRERYSLEPNMDPNAELHIEYRDEASNGGFYSMETEEDLRVALERNSKLTLRVGADSSSY